MKGKEKVMKKRKLISMGLTVCMLAGLIVSGCGKSEGEEKGKEGKSDGK